jgi:hypothetical protein
MTAKFDPYHKWLAIPPDEQPPNHYRLLGLQLFEADQEVIAAAAVQRMNWVRKFQKGEQAATAQRVAKEITDAWASLLNVERKRSYDAELKKGVDAAELAKELASVPQLPSRSITAAVGVSQEVRNLPPAPPSTKAAPSAIPKSDLALPLLDSAPTIPDGVIGSKPGPSRGWRRAPKNPTAFDSDSHGFPTSPTPAKKADSALDLDFKSPARTANKNTKRRKSKSPMVALAKHAIASIAGLILGYLILCWIGPQYDFLGLMRSGPPEKEKPPVAPLVEPPEIPETVPHPPVEPPVKGNRFCYAILTKTILPALRSSVETAIKVTEWAADQNPFAWFSSELDRVANLSPVPAQPSPKLKSKAAMVRAVDWLAKRQRNDGFWSLKDDGAENENLEGATALALLAIVREDNWRSVAAHSLAVSKGWRALIGSQQKNGQFLTKAPTAQQPYTHAIATMVACELYAKTRGPTYQSPRKWVSSSARTLKAIREVGDMSRKMTAICR